MSARHERAGRSACSPHRSRGGGRAGRLRPRDLLLRVHRHRLRREDLEDCYSQATLELLARAARERAVRAAALHIANALEQRFLSRIQDRRRALAGRSPMQAALARRSRSAPATSTASRSPIARAELEQLVISAPRARVGSRALARAAEPRPATRARLQLAADGCAEFCRARLDIGEVPQGRPARPGAAATADVAKRRTRCPAAPSRSEQRAGTRL